MEERGLNLVDHRHGAERVRITPFENRDGEGAEEEEDDEHKDNEIGIHVPTVNVTELLPQLRKNGVPKTTQDNRDTERRRNPRISGKTRHAVAVQSKARVVER